MGKQSYHWVGLDIFIGLNMGKRQKSFANPNLQSPFLFRRFPLQSTPHLIREGRWFGREKSLLRMIRVNRRCIKHRFKKHTPLTKSGEDLFEQRHDSDFFQIKPTNNIFGMISLSGCVA